MRKKEKVSREVNRLTLLQVLFRNQLLHYFLTSCSIISQLVVPLEKLAKESNKANNIKEFYSIPLRL